MKLIVPIITLLLTLSVHVPTYADDIGRISHHFGNAYQKSDIHSMKESLNSYIELAESMRDYVNLDDFGKYYLPLKIKANKVIIALNVLGPFPKETKARLSDLKKFVKENSDEYEKLFEIQIFEGVAEDLMSLAMIIIRDTE